jgi:hypothetical protein
MDATLPTKREQSRLVHTCLSVHPSSGLSTAFGQSCTYMQISIRTSWCCRNNVRSGEDQTYHGYGRRCKDTLEPDCSSRFSDVQSIELERNSETSVSRVCHARKTYVCIIIHFMNASRKCVRECLCTSHTCVHSYSCVYTDMRHFCCVSLELDVHLNNSFHYVAETWNDTELSVCRCFGVSIRIAVVLCLKMGVAVVIHCWD